MTERGNAAPVLEPVAAAPRPAIMRAERYLSRRLKIDSENQRSTEL